MSLPTIDELMTMEVSETFAPIPVGFYNGVITGAEVATGAKGPYIKVEVTIHDEEYRGRKVWRNAVSFSEKAIGMPGGVAQLLQATKPDLPRDAAAEELPSIIATFIVSTPIKFEVEHDQVKRGGKSQFLADGSPEMRAGVRQWFEAEADFISSVEADAAGIDDDLPF